MQSSAETSCPTNPHPAPPQGRRAILKIALVIAVLAGALAAIQFTPIRAWLANKEQLKKTLDSAGLLAYPLVALAIAALVACGIPRLLLCGVAGAVLGFWPGLLLACAGTLIGYYALFLFVRWGGRDWVLHRWPKLRNWTNFSETQGIITVILIRQVPIHGMVANLAFGLSHLKHRHFVIGTGIGLFPEAIPVTLVGTGLSQGSLKDSIHYLILAAVALVLIWLICHRLFKLLRVKQGALNLPSDSDNP